MQRGLAIRSISVSKDTGVQFTTARLRGATSSYSKQMTIAHAFNVDFITKALNALCVARFSCTLYSRRVLKTLLLEMRPPRSSTSYTLEQGLHQEFFKKIFG